MAGLFRFQCSCCGKWQESIPGFAFETPLYYGGIPIAEREARCRLSSDTCTVDDQFFFIRGCIEIPVFGAEEPFIWGVWVSLSRASFDEYLAHWDESERSSLGPYFGWLSANFTVYPNAENLKTLVYPRDHGQRPYIEVQPTDHPLAIEQRTGIDVVRLGEIFAAYGH